MTRTPTLDAAARDELARKANFTASTLRIVANDAALEGGESPEWFNLEFLRGAADVILALLAAVERGAADTPKLEPHQRDALAWSIRYLRSGGTRPSPKQIDWAWDGVCALTPSEVLAYHAARATPTGADHAE